MSQFESNLQRADIQAQQQGKRGLAQAQSQQRQLQAKQDAAIKEAQLQYETELQKRRQQVASTAIGIAGTLATIPFGGGGSLISRGLGAIAGKGAGEITSSMLADTARAGVGNPQPQDNVIQPDINPQMGFDAGQPMDVPQQQGGQVTPQQALQQDKATQPLDQAFQGSGQQRNTALDMFSGQQFNTIQRSLFNGKNVDVPTGSTNQTMLDLKQGYLNNLIKQENNPNRLQELLNLSRQLQSGQNVDLSSYGYNPQQQLMNVLQ